MNAPANNNRRRAAAALEADLLMRVRARGRVSRVALARDLGVVPSTAGIYVDRLIAEGYLLEGPAAARGMGRPPNLLTLNPEGGSFVGVDFEARNLVALRVDFSQHPLGEVRRAVTPSDGAGRLMREIGSAVAAVLGRDRRSLLGIGIGLPGAIDPTRGLALAYERVPGWRNLPVGARLEHRFGAPVSLENNIRSMALAEMLFGLGRGLDDFICLGTRSGIAAGIVIGGRLLRGHNHRAGEVGHWWCTESGGRLEDVASLTAILREMRAARTRRAAPRRRANPTIEDFLDAVNQGDRFACRLLKRVAAWHGWAIHHLVDLFNPQRVILAGPLTVLGERFLGPIRERVAGGSFPGAAPDIVPSALGDSSAALGAAALALQQWTPATARGGKEEA